MISGPQTNATADARVEVRPVDELRHDSDLAVPAALGRVDRDVDVEVEAAPKAPELRPVEEVGGCPAAVQEGHIAVLRTPAQNGIHGRPERGETDSSRHDHDVAADGLLDGPGVAERPADAEHSARLGGADRARDGADRAHRVHERPRDVARHRDRHLADPERVEHGELPGSRQHAFAADRLQLERPRVGELAPPFRDAERERDHRPDRRPGLSCDGHRRTRRGAAAASTGGGGS